MFDDPVLAKGTPEMPKYRDIMVGVGKHAPPGNYNVVIVATNEGYNEHGSFEVRRYLALEGDDTWKVAPQQTSEHITLTSSPSVG